MKKIIILLIAILTLNACEDNEPIIEPSCGEEVIIDAALYNATITSTYTITDVSVSETCIIIRISASGCDGKTWMTSLIDSEQVSSNPSERFLRLALVNNEECQTVPERANTFDVRSLRTNSTEPLLLNLEGWNDQIIIN